MTGFSRRRKRFGLLTLGIMSLSLLGILALAGCGSSSSSTPTVTVSPSPGTTVDQPGWTVNNAATVQTTRPWTFLVYMNGANDLDSYGLFNFHQMESVGSDSNVNIVVQFKRGQGTDSLTGYTYDTTNGGWSGTRRYYVTQSTNQTTINSLLLSTNTTADMGNYQTLQSFIQWGIQTYPAQHYCLVVWDHGSGWRSETIPSKAVSVASGRSAIATNTAVNRGVSFDQVSQDYILSTQLSQAIDMGNGRKWDLVAWDSSLMQMIENDYQIKDQAQYIVGSEESPPGGGYPYNTILADLTANPTWDGKALGTDMAQKTLAYYQTSPTIVGAKYDDSYITQSVIDASKLEAIASALNSFGTAMNTAESQYGSAIALARTATEQFGIYDVTQSDPTFQFYESDRDPVDFLHQLVDVQSGTVTPRVSDSGVQATANLLRNAFNAAIVYNVTGPQHTDAHGLAMYIPTPADYATDVATQLAGGAFGYGTNISYSSLAIAQAAPNWLTFIKTATK